MYFIAIDTAISGRRPLGRTLYQTKVEAMAEVERLQRTQVGCFSAMDADHEPGKTILRNRREF